MNKTLLMVGVLVGLSMGALAGVPGVQRYNLEPKTAKANAAKVAADLAKAGRKNAPVALYTVAPMSAIKRVPNLYPTDGRLFAPLSWIASRGEFEPASFLMYATAGDFTDVSVECGDLVSKAGGRIPAAAIDFKIVKCWYQGGSAWYGYFADACGRTLVPELLLHDENLIWTDDDTQDYYVRYENEDGQRRYQWMSSRFEVSDYSFVNQANQGLIRDAETLQPFVLNRGEFKQLLATIRVPSDAKGGIYRGALKLKAKGREIAALDLRCRVLPLDLPEPKTQYDPEKGFYLCLYGTGTRNPKVMKDVAEHNCLTPMGFPKVDPMNPSGLDRDIELAKAYGLKTQPVLFGVTNCGLVNWGSGAPTPEFVDKLNTLSNTVAKTRALAIEKLGHTDFYSYGVDEGGPATIRGERDAWRIVHEAGGKIGVTSFAWRELLFALDLMILPSMPVEHRQKEVKLFHDSNPDALCGWYANPHCGPENPDYFRRIHGLMAWQAGYDVSLNYCWWRNNWNDMAVPYEPNLRAIVSAYGTEDSVLDTLAWDAIREGLDDIRYATLVKQLALKAAKCEDKPEALMRGRRVLSWLAYWDGYRMDPDAFKAEAVNYILELNELLKK